MTKRLKKSHFIIFISVMTMLSMLLLFSVSETAYAEDTLPTEYWESGDVSSLQGAGSELSPFLISNANELAYLAEEVNSGNTFADTYFELSNDIDLAGKLFTPIGYYTGVDSRVFNGNFNGGGYTLKSLIINQPDADNTGLFGYIGNGAYVGNFIIGKGSIVNGGSWTGSVVGRNNSGTVEDVVSFADINAVSFIGGIVGDNAASTSSIINVAYGGTITAGSAFYGIVGTNNSGFVSASWFLTSNQGYIHNNEGNILDYSVNGKIDIAMENGDIFFTLTPDGIQYTIEIRALNETLISTDSIYNPDPSLNNVKYLARFVDKGYWGVDEVTGFLGSGSVATPYLITNVHELAFLANQVESGNTYSGRHFNLTTDLFLDGYLTKPIGSYVSGTNNRPFLGHFNGQGYTLHSVHIYEQTNNVGLFGFIGNGGSVKNLVIDSDSEIIGNRWVGSVTGRLQQAQIISVLSLAKVKGESQVGGIVGNNYQGSVMASTYYGEILADVGGYGIEGASLNSTVMDSWYVTEHIGYEHQFGGNILYNCENGDLNATLLDEVVFFTLIPNAGFSAEIRTLDETVISSNLTFYPQTSLNNMRYFARFVKTVSINPVANAVVTGANTYYEGQLVTINIKPSEGYYLNEVNAGAMPNSFTYSNHVDNSINFRFNMEDIDFVFSVNIQEFIAEAGTIETEFTYDGEPKIVTTPAILKDSYPNFNFNVTYISGAGTLPAPPTLSNNYQANILIFKEFNGASVIIGQKIYNFVILKAPLQINDDSLLEKVKQYDNQPTIQLDILDNFTTIGNDIVTMRANVTYYTDAALSNIALSRGENYYVKYTFVIQGAQSGNYLPPEPIVLQGGEIIQRTAVVTVEQEYLMKSYNELAPSISTYSADSVGGIDIEFVYTLIESPNPSAVMGDVGTYSVTVQFKDGVYNPNNENHILLLGDTYIYSIVPAQSNVTFEHYTGLSYTGSVQSITARQSTIHATQALAANLIYYLDGLESSLLDAGSYTAVASSSNYNYVLTGNTTINFTVSKINQSDISVTQIATQTYGALPITLSIEGGDGDGEVQYSLLQGYGEINDDELVIMGGGVFRVIVSRGESKNYFAATSEAMEFLVEKVDLIVSVTNVTNIITYDDVLDLDVTYSGFIPSDSHLTQPEGLIRPVITIGSLSYIYGNTVRLAANAEGYNLTLSGGSSYGYNIIADNSNQAKLIVERKQITVRATPRQKTYGQNDPLLLYTIDEGSYTLSGVLSRDPGSNVGEYDINQNTVIDANNTNFIITFIPAKFTINKATLTVRPFAKSKAYGELDPIIEYDIIGLVGGDTYQLEISRTPGENPGVYPYILEYINVSDNYEVTFTVRNLIINTIIPVVSILPNRSEIVYGDPLSASVFSAGEIKATNNQGELVITGTYQWSVVEQFMPMPDVSDSNVTLYEVRFTPDDSTNYREITFNCTVTVLPKILNVVFTGNSNLVYSGLAQKTITAVPQGILYDDEVNFDYYYNGEMINAGVYHVIPEINNPNYALDPENVHQVIINKKGLEISIQSVVYNDDNVPAPTFIYTGFVSGENKNVLNEMPQAIMPTEAGTFSVTPYGAEADNYNITYRARTVTVTQSVLYSGDDNVTVLGAFDAKISFIALEITKDDTSVFDELVNIFKDYKRGKHELNGLVVKRAYDFTMYDDGIEIQPDGMIKIKILLSDALSKSRNFAVLHYKEDGSVEIVENATIEGRYLILEVDSLSYFVLATNNDYTIIVIVIVIILLLAGILMLDLGVRIKRRRKLNREIDYQKRYVNAYKQAKRDKRMEAKIYRMQGKEEKRRQKQFKYVSRDQLKR